MNTPLLFSMLGTKQYPYGLMKFPKSNNKLDKYSKDRSNKKLK